MREMVKRVELLRLINTELSRLGIPEGIRAREDEGVFRLIAPDSDGVNWGDHLKFDVRPGDVLDVHLNDIQAAVDWARARYNLMPEGDSAF
jgi:hypothetical protein